MSDNPNSSKLQIKELDMSRMCSNASIITIAKRGSGKTWLCRSLIDHYSDIPVGVIISYTDSLDPFYKNFFPDAFIYHKTSQHVFKKILKRQIKIKERAEQLALKGIKIDTRILLLMDDCLSDAKGWAKDEALREILFNGRHYDITYILTMQAPLEITPSLRDNFDYVCLFNTDVVNDQKKLYNHYAGVFPTFNAFKEVYSQLTANFGMMVLCRRNTGPKLTDKVFHYKATAKTPRMFGCQQVKKFQEKNYNPEWRKGVLAKIVDFDMEGPRRNYQHIPVEKVDLSGHAKYD
jgi:hypothetical protein